MKKRIALLRGLWISGVVACSSGALAQSTPTFRYGKLGADGVWLSQFDNPVFEADYTLAADETANRKFDSSVGDYFNYFYYELHLKHTCTATSQYCVPVEGDRSRPEDGTFRTWPRVQGDWVGGQGVPLEHHGLRIGAETSTVELIKSRDWVDTPLMSNPPRVRMDSSVIVVPVNVIHVLPAASVAPDDAQKAEAYADPAVYRAMFDDEWELHYNTVGSQWHRPEYFQGAWYNRTSGGGSNQFRTAEMGGGSAIPDDVFAQCGIQFRLQSVSFVHESRPEVIYTQYCPTNNAIAGNAIRGYRDGWIKTAVVGPGAELVYGNVIPDAMNIVFIPWITQRDASQCKTISVADPKKVVFAYEQNSSMEQNYRNLTLAHEIGHGLNLLDHTSDSAYEQLMYVKGGPAHVSGCHRRDGVALSELPFGCYMISTDAVDKDAACGIAREGAREILAENASPNSGLSGMEPPASTASATWTMSTGAAPVFNTTLSTEGNASLEAPGGGYIVASSPIFKTADVQEVGTELAVDVYLQSPQPNPYWLGSIDAFVTIPAAGFYNAYLGHVEFTGLGLDQWSTVTFPVSGALREAFLDDLPIAQIAFAVNTPGGAPAVYLDGLTFAGTLEPRVIPHTGPLAGGASNAFLSFEQAGDWSASNGSASLSDEWTDAEKSLSVDGTGWVEIASRSFLTTELPAVTSRLTVDIKIPTNPPNPYWLGSLALFVSCPSANLYNQSVGQQDLQHRFQGEFNTLEYSLPATVATALASPSNTCTLKFALNVSAGSGRYLLDHVAFH